MILPERLDYLSVREIAKRLGVDVVTISGVASRLSARMKKVMLERDKGVFAKSVHLLT